MTFRYSVQGGGAAKRSFEDIDNPTAADLALMSRSERKRHREKRRRSKVNAGFDDLKSLLATIDPETADQEDIDSTPNNDDGDQSEDDESPAEVVIDLVRPISKRSLLASG